MTPFFPCKTALSSAKGVNPYPFRPRQGVNPYPFFFLQIIYFCPVRGIFVPLPPAASGTPVPPIGPFIVLKHKHGTQTYRAQAQAVPCSDTSSRPRIVVLRHKDYRAQTQDHRAQTQARGQYLREAKCGFAPQIGDFFATPAKKNLMLRRCNMLLFTGRNVFLSIESRWKEKGGCRGEEDFGAPGRALGRVLSAAFPPAAGGPPGRVGPGDTFGFCGREGFALAGCSG